MEAISKRSGKKFTGKLAALMVKVGVASPLKEAQKGDSENEVMDKPKRVIQKQQKRK